MPFTRVQTTPIVKIQSNIVTVTFGALPVVGNAVIVTVLTWGGGEVVCEDNQGHVYESVATVFNNQRTSIFLCSKINQSSGSFKVTVSGPFTWYLATAIEVDADTTKGLFIGRVTTSWGGTARPTTGSSGPMVAASSFVVAAHALGSSQSFITVDPDTPAWTQIHEELTTSFVAGEIDYRVIGESGSTLGTTQSCSWTLSTPSNWAAALATFVRGEDLPSQPARVTQDAIETLTRPKTDARVGQEVVEVLSRVSQPARVTQDAVEALVQAKPDARVGQDAIETLILPKGPSRVSQSVIEIITQPKPPIRVSQVVAEAVFQPHPNAVVSQFVVEGIQHPQPAGRIGQVVVETIWTVTHTYARLSQMAVETIVHVPKAPVGAGVRNIIWMGDSEGNPWIE